jgi:hypothetical protein
MPTDVIEDLKRVAPVKGMTGYQTLMKFYIRQGLREDLQLLWEEEQRARELDMMLGEFGLKEDQKDRLRNFLREGPEQRVG